MRYGNQSLGKYITMRKKIVAGNWKMHGSRILIQQLLDDIKRQLPRLPEGVNAVVFPPAMYVPLVASILQDSALQWGGQNVYTALLGAYTGEHSILMFQDYDCRYMLVGHSERRHIFHETEKNIAEKFHLVKEHGMIPVLCVGETLNERESGATKHVLHQQLSMLLNENPQCFKNAVLAYEPVWAIGTGHTAHPEQAQEAHAFIREEIARFDACVSQEVTILYGGSVNKTNAASLFAMPDVDGGLVGGASLNASQFVEIISCIS